MTSESNNPNDPNNHKWYLLDRPGWNQNLDLILDLPSGTGLLYLIKNPINTGIFNTKIEYGYHSKSPEPHFLVNVTVIPKEKILAWRFFNPIQDDPKYKNPLEPHEYALLAGFVSGCIHNKTLQGSLFENLHKKLLRIIGVDLD